MTPCTREPETIQAITSAAGGSVLSSELQEHMRDCADCREAAAVSSAFMADHAAALHEISAPSADFVWFRAQLKARAEAAQLAARPVFVVQALAAAAVAGAVTAITTMMGAFDITAVAGRGLLLAFAVWLLIVPVAVYLAAMEE